MPPVQHVKTAVSKHNSLILSAMPVKFLNQGFDRLQLAGFISFLAYQLTDDLFDSNSDYAEFFDLDPARANIAEVAFGVNDKAKVTGVVLEDEKAGFHWAFGRSDHLGGVVGVEDFAGPDTVVHQDIVYAKGNPIQVEQADVIHGDGRRVTVIADGEYVL